MSVDSNQQSPSGEAALHAAGHSDSSHSERCKGSPWYGWIAGVGTLLTMAGLLVLDKYDNPKHAATTAPKEVQADVAAVPAPAAVAAKAEAPDEAVAPKADVKVEAEPVAAPEAAPEAKEASAAAAAIAGVTSYYGESEGGGQVMAWSADAAMNPDYSGAEPAAKAEPEAQPGAAEGAAPAVTAVVDEAPAPAVEAPAPVSSGGVGITSYYGDGQTPDAGQPWAAAAEMNPEYASEAPVADVAEAAPAAAVEAPAPAAEPVSGVTSAYESSTWTAPENYYAPVEATETAPAPAVEEAAPVAVAEPVPGVTSQYESSTWTAPANYVAPAEAAAAPAACHDALMAALKAGKLNFEISSWDILEDSYSTLDKIAEQAKGCAGVSIEVAGHTDNTGKPASNKTLSELRAQAVVKYLTRAGVDAGKLKAVGYGQDKPIADNETDVGRAQNRRIEFGVTAN